jgi:hypothetical protein
MKLESFDDVLTSTSKNPGRKFHLLLGNGFSIAYDSTIFSYNALHDFVTKIGDKDLSIILGVLATKNFEVIMQQLDNFSGLIAAFGGDPKLKKKVDAASAKLKKSLLDAVKALHPEHVFMIPELPQGFPEFWRLSLLHQLRPFAVLGTYAERSP